MATILIDDHLAANRKILVTHLRYQGHRLLDAADRSLKGRGQLIPL